MPPITVARLPMPGRVVSVFLDTPLRHYRAAAYPASVRIAGRTWTADAFALLDRSGAVLEELRPPLAEGAVVVLEEHGSPHVRAWARVLELRQPPIVHAIAAPVARWRFRLEVATHHAERVTREGQAAPWGRV